MALYIIHSECQLMEQSDYNLLFRWFVGFSMDDKVWNHSTFTKNRDRLLEGDLARRFFAQVLGQAEQAGLLSKEHFSVDGTMIEALASLKSYRPKEEDGPPGGGSRNPDVDFHGKKRSRDTHESKTDKDALLFRMSKGTAGWPTGQHCMADVPLIDALEKVQLKTPALSDRFPLHLLPLVCQAKGCKEQHPHPLNLTAETLPCYRISILAHGGRLAPSPWSNWFNDQMGRYKTCFSEPSCQYGTLITPGRFLMPGTQKTAGPPSRTAE